MLNPITPTIVLAHNPSLDGHDNPDTDYKWTHELKGTCQTEHPAVYSVHEMKTTWNAETESWEPVDDDSSILPEAERSVNGKVKVKTNFSLRVRFEEDSTDDLEAATLEGNVILLNRLKKHHPKSDFSHVESLLTASPDTLQESPPDSITVSLISTGTQEKTPLHRFLMGDISATIDGSNRHYDYNTSSKDPSLHRYLTCFSPWVPAARKVQDKIHWKTSGGEGQSLNTVQEIVVSTRDDNKHASLEVLELDMQHTEFDFAPDAESV